MTSHYSIKQEQQNLAPNATVADSCVDGNHQHNMKLLSNGNKDDADGNNSKPLSLTLNKSNISPPRGSATMPRRRISYLATTTAPTDLNNHKAAAMTLDKQFPGINVDKNVVNSEAVAAAAGGVITNGISRKMAGSLDNLLDLNDEDGEDPYGVLQDYLERVKVSTNKYIYFWIKLIKKCLDAQIVLKLSKYKEKNINKYLANKIYIFC